jgi:hypothetical protein
MVKKIEDVSWNATEYIVRSHDGWWYLGLVLVTVALGALAVFLKSWTFLALIVLSSISLIIYTIRPPRKIHYELNSKGLQEDNRFHDYTDFRAFGILKEGANFSAVLIPKKRLGLSVKVYFPEGSGEAIVDALGARLPMEEVKLDFLDKIVNFLRI